MDFTVEFCVNPECIFLCHHKDAPSSVPEYVVVICKAERASS